MGVREEQGSEFVSPLPFAQPCRILRPALQTPSVLCIPNFCAVEDGRAQGRLANKIGSA
jgi:hypothetical protein